MKKLQRVLIMAGGTGGHVFPGIALANYLRLQGVDVHWLGTNQGLEARVVPEAGIPLHAVTIKGVRGKGIKTLLLAPFKITASILQSLKLIKSIQPDVVVGMGGYVSGPGGIAAWLSRRPLIIHEQNAIAGYTNKLLGKFAYKVLTGFPGAFKASTHVMTIGNPVREAIEHLPPPIERFKSSTSRPLHLLVLGGSLGAQALNSVIPEVLALLSQDEKPEVLHQTGEKHFEETKKLYESSNLRVDIKPFIEDMAAAYAWADMVICRAGALTVAELCSAGLGAVFVPFPFAVDDHQTANAFYMVKQQAAYCIQQSELTAERLTAIVREFALAPEKRLAMANAAYALRQPNVVEKIYNVCKESCH
jgi:UDP-N-acetylglucosamine--N-acetylmuramyl-(pentapeptide) pyrophosphoryl-undecaprenol N-acetylglucosamine transferase